MGQSQALGGQEEKPRWPHLCTRQGSSQSSGEGQHGGREGLSVRKGISQQGGSVQEGWCRGNFQKPDAYLGKSGCHPGPGVGDKASQKTLSLSRLALLAAPEELTPQGQWDPGVFPGAPAPSPHSGGGLPQGRGGGTQPHPGPWQGRRGPTLDQSVTPSAAAENRAGCWCPVHRY